MQMFIQTYVCTVRCLQRDICTQRVSTELYTKVSTIRNVYKQRVLTKRIYTNSCPQRGISTQRVSKVRAVYTERCLHIKMSTHKDVYT